MYTRIMAAIDDSFATSKVLDAAIEMAQKFDAKLAICHALDVTIFAQGTAATWLSNGVSQIESSLRDSALVFVDEAAKVARAAGLDVEIKLVESEQTHVAEMLADASTEWQDPRTPWRRPLLCRQCRRTIGAQGENIAAAGAFGVRAERRVKRSSWSVPACEAIDMRLPEHVIPVE